MTIELRTITADERGAFRKAVRAGFGGQEFVADAEWEESAVHPLDRVRAAFDGGAIVATLHSFPNEVTVPGGGTVAAGALTAVTCRSTHRRQGLLTRLISDDLAESRERGEVVGVLISAEYPIYGRFGYGPATLATSWELDAAADFVTPGEGTVELIDNETFRKEAPAIFERVRSARPGMIARDDLAWDVRADLRRRPEDKPWPGFRVLCRDDDGVSQGWANYRIKDNWVDHRPKGVAEVDDMCAATPAAVARLWRFLADLDLVASVSAGDRPTDEVLPWLLADARMAKQTSRADFLWLRPLDVASLLESRIYADSGHVVLEVADRQGLAAGRFALDASPDGVSCRPTDEPADLTMPVAVLGSATLGGMSVATMHAAGWLDEHSPGAVARTDAMFTARVAPWCNTWF